MLFGMLKGYEKRLDALENAGMLQANADEMNEVEPTKTIELTKDEIMRLKELLMYKILEAGVEGVTNHIMRTMRDADEYLLNKLDGK
jgi:hypothetical protein